MSARVREVVSVAAGMDTRAYRSSRSKASSIVLMRERCALSCSYRSTCGPEIAGRNAQRRPLTSPSRPGFIMWSMYRWRSQISGRISVTSTPAEYTRMTELSDTTMAMAPVELEIDAAALCRLPGPRGRAELPTGAVNGLCEPFDRPTDRCQLGPPPAHQLTLQPVFLRLGSGPGGHGPGPGRAPRCPCLRSRVANVSPAATGALGACQRRPRPPGSGAPPRGVRGHPRHHSQLRPVRSISPLATIPPPVGLRPAVDRPRRGWGDNDVGGDRHQPALRFPTADRDRVGWMFRSRENEASRLRGIYRPDDWTLLMTGTAAAPGDADPGEGGAAFRMPRD